MTSLLFYSSFETPISLEHQNILTALVFFFRNHHTYELSLSRY